MNLDLEGKCFLVCGASSGFGRSIATALAREKATVIAVARREERLKALKSEYPHHITYFVGDITQSETIEQLTAQLEGKKMGGVVINAGGPPACSFLETKLDDWDQSYNNLLRWKVEITKKLLPGFLNQGYGRWIFIESISVKQPVENLVLSNSLRLAVTGFVKTLSQEIGDKGITMNIMAPGYHDTPAMDRIIKKKSDVEHIPEEEARNRIIQELKVRKMGDPNDFAMLALWLLSPSSWYVTGQTISVDGGRNRHIFG